MRVRVPPPATGELFKAQILEFPFGGAAGDPQAAQLVLSLKVASFLIENKRDNTGRG